MIALWLLMLLFSGAQRAVLRVIEAGDYQSLEIHVGCRSFLIS